MFAVLKIKESEKGIAAKINERIKRNEPTIYKVNLKGGTPFLEIEVKTRKGKINWEQIEQALGKYSRKMLLPEKITSPRNCNINQLNLTDTLPARIMFNTAIEVLSHCDIPPYNRKISVIDENGIYLDMIESLVNSAAILKIITNRIGEYERLANCLLEEYGASLIISSDIESAKDSHIIITPTGLIPNQTNALIFTCRKSNEKVSRTLYCPPLKLPDELNEILPKGVSEHKFTCALYEYCSLKSLDKKRFDMMLTDGFEIGVYSMARMIY